MIRKPYERPVHARYLDPVEVVWIATLHRLGMTLRRDPSIFSRTDGSGMLWLGPREDLDADDTVAQMILHELCHWITNGVDSFSIPDWGFHDDTDDPREYACLRLQAWLADRHGLRGMFGPTGQYREYFDRIGADPLTPFDDSVWEADIHRLALQAIATAQGAPFHPVLDEAFAATAAIRQVVRPFLTGVTSEVEGDTLPSLWSR